MQTDDWLKPNGFIGDCCSDCTWLGITWYKFFFDFSSLKTSDFHGRDREVLVAREKRLSNRESKKKETNFVLQGRRHSTEVAFALLTQPSRVRFSHLTAGKNRTQRVTVCICFQGNVVSPRSGSCYDYQSRRYVGRTASFASNVRSTGSSRITLNQVCCLWRPLSNRKARDLWLAASRQSQLKLQKNSSIY